MTIGVMAPSSYVDRGLIEQSATLLRGRGYEVFIHPQTYEQLGQSAGDMLQKTLALQGLWHRKDIDAIWFAGGGNQSLPLLGSLPFDKLKALPPKILLGFSDNTALLNALSYHCDAPAYHAPVFKQLAQKDPQELGKLFAILEGDETQMSFSEAQILVSGAAEAPLIGGNLSLVQYLPSLLGADYFEGKILFLEDHGEELSRIERILSFLATAGIFSNLKGLMLGQFSACTDSGRPFGMSVPDMIAEHCAGLQCPVLTDLPFGHAGEFFPLLIGSTAKIDCQNKQITLCSQLFSHNT